MIVYITVLEAVLFLRFTFTAGLQHARLRSMVSTSAFKHNDQTSKSNIDLLFYSIVRITGFDAVVFIFLLFAVIPGLQLTHFCAC